MSSFSLQDEEATSQNVMNQMLGGRTLGPTLKASKSLMESEGWGVSTWSEPVQIDQPGIHAAGPSGTVGQDARVGWNYAALPEVAARNALSVAASTSEGGFYRDITTYDEEEFMEWGAETSDGVQSTELIPQRSNQDRYESLSPATSSVGASASVFPPTPRSATSFGLRSSPIDIGRAAHPAPALYSDDRFSLDQHPPFQSQPLQPPPYPEHQPSYFCPSSSQDSSHFRYQYSQTFDADQETNYGRGEARSQTLSHALYSTPSYWERRSDKNITSPSPAGPGPLDSLPSSYTSGAALYGGFGSATFLSSSQQPQAPGLLYSSSSPPAVFNPRSIDPALFPSVLPFQPAPIALPRTQTTNDAAAHQSSIKEGPTRKGHHVSFPTERLSFEGLPSGAKTIHNPQPSGQPYSFNPPSYKRYRTEEDEVKMNALPYPELHLPSVGRILKKFDSYTKSAGADFLSSGVREQQHAVGQVSVGRTVDVLQKKSKSGRVVRGEVVEPSQKAASGGLKKGTKKGMAGKGAGEVEAKTERGKVGKGGAKKNDGTTKRQQCQKSCTSCAELKKGCDGERPCGRCIRFQRSDRCVDPVRVIKDKTKKKSVPFQETYSHVKDGHHGPPSAAPSSPLSSLADDDDPPSLSVLVPCPTPSPPDPSSLAPTHGRNTRTNAAKHPAFFGED